MRVVQWLVLILAASLPVSGGFASAQKEESPDLEGSQGAAAAIYTLKVHMDLEKARLSRFLEEYQTMELRRDELQARISLLYDNLGSAVRRGSTSPEEED